MSTLRSVAMVLLVVGIIGLIFPTVVPGAEFIKWAVILALIVFVADLFTGRKTV
jgi:membrane-bound ClpP family serine protease